LLKKKSLKVRTTRAPKEAAAEIKKQSRLFDEPHQQQN
jgi:hypothetical protein